METNGLLVMQMSDAEPPEGVTLTKNLDAEQIDIQTSFKVPQWVALLVSYSILFAAIGLIGLISIFEKSSTMHGLIDVLLVAGPLGTLLAAFRLGWYGPGWTRRVRLELTATTCLLNGRRVAWGDVDEIVIFGEDVCFVLDGGRKVPVGMRRLRPDQKSWLLSRLRRRLKVLAPGSPVDVPGTLVGVRSEASQRSSP